MKTLELKQKSIFCAHTILSRALRGFAIGYGLKTLLALVRAATRFAIARKRFDFRKVFMESDALAFGGSFAMTSVMYRLAYRYFLKNRDNHDEASVKASAISAMAVRWSVRNIAAFCLCFSPTCTHIHPHPHTDGIGSGFRSKESDGIVRSDASVRVDLCALVENERWCAEQVRTENDT